MIGEKTEELCFDVDLEEVPVKFTRTIIDEQTGNPVIDPETNKPIRKSFEYLLVAMSGVERDAWMNNLAKRSTITGTGKDATSIITKWDEYDAQVLFGCLLEMPSRRVLTIAEIQALPGKVSNALADKCRQISGLTAEAKEEAKND